MEAQTPRGINHVVLNVRSMEESHRFWTEIMGFRQVGELRPRPGRSKMRFYSGIDEHGEVTHHDLALAEVPEGGAAPTREPWTLTARAVGLNHVDVTVSARAWVLEFGMGVDVHGGDGTKAACRAVSDAIRHSSLPLFPDVRVRGGRMLVEITVGVPDPASVDLDRVRHELPHGEVTVRAVNGGLRVPGADTLIACAAITVRIEDGAAS